MQTALEIGATVAGFRIEAVVGQGASGTVYRAVDTDGTVVALKVLDPALALDRRFRARFEREAALAAQLHHPHVVPVLATGAEGGIHYLAMTFVAGSDLRTLLRDHGRLEPAAALALFGGIADALDAAHAVGLVHRDVTPSNVLVGTVEGVAYAYLTDFGLARHATTPSSLTGERSFVGTIDYIAPEQIRGEPLDGRADQYSLACVLAESITGTPPFARDSDVATVYAHLHEPPHPLGDDLPPALGGALGRGLAKEPRDRFGSCRALIDAALAALDAPRVPARRRRSAIAVAAMVAIGVAAGGVVLAGRDTRHGPAGVAPAATAARVAAALPLGADQVALLDPERRRVVGEAPLPGPVVALVVTSDARWAVIADPARIVRLDGVNGRTTRSVELPFAPGGAAADGTSVWVAEAGGPGLIRVTADGRIARRLSVPERSGEGGAIAFAGGAVWLARSSTVLRIDPARGRVTDVIAAPRAADYLAAGDGTVWAAGGDDGRLLEIDAATRRVIARPRLHGYVTDIAVGGGSAWVTVTPEDRVYQVNADDGSVQGAFAAGAGPESVAYESGMLLIANGREGVLSRIDVGSGARTTFRTGAAPMLVRTGGGAASVVAVAGAPPLPPVPGGNEVRVSLPDDGLSGDPATAIGPVSVQLAYQTCLRLETYADAGGAAGRQLVPDAAAASPVLSADGRSYTWRLRPGLRFSPPSGAPITAATFAASLERALAPGLGPRAAAPHLLGDVVGVADYIAGRAAHVRGIVAAGGRLTITIAHPTGDFRARLAQPFSCAVPPGTPVVPDGVGGPLASGGPYYVASRAPGRTVLERNPAYTGTRPRRPQRIVYETGVPTGRGAAELAAGRIDYLPYDYDGTGALAEGGALDRAYGPGSSAARRGDQRYYRTPVPGLDLLAFNTRRPLFRDVRMRQAVSAALDRSAIAGVWHEPSTDRFVPPAVLDTPNGAAYPVTRPDLARARRLTHGVRGTAVLYFCGPPENRRVAALIRASLAPIGIAVRPAPSLDCVLGRDPKIAGADLMLVSPATPVLDPAAFVEAALGRNSILGDGFMPPGWFHDPPLDAAAMAARPLQGAARTAAYAALQDRLLAAAPLAGLGSWTAPEYVAPRLGCRVFQGAYGSLDLAAACPAAG